MKCKSVLTVVCKPRLSPSIVSLSLSSSVPMKANLYVLYHFSFLVLWLPVEFYKQDRSAEDSRAGEERGWGYLLPLFFLCQWKRSTLVIEVARFFQGPSPQVPLLQGTNDNALLPSTPPFLPHTLLRSLRPRAAFQSCPHLCNSPFIELGSVKFFWVLCFLLKF